MTFASHPARALATTVALLALVSGACAAPDTVLGRSSASLLDVGYRLVDLDTSDGITPWIRFSNDEQLRLTVPGSDQQLSSGLNRPGSDVVAAPDGRGSVSRSLNSFHAESVSRVRDLNLPLEQGFDERLVNAWSSEIWPLADGYGLPTWRFELSPMTAVIFEGVVKADTSVDLSALVGAGLVDGRVAPYSSLLVAATSSVSLGLWPSSPDNLTPGLPDYLWKVASSSATLDPNGWGPTPPDVFSYPTSLDETWSFRYDHQQATSWEGRLMFDVRTEAVVVATPVPEADALILASVGACIALLRGRGARRRSSTLPDCV